jgi:hypothetical protein
MCRADNLATLMSQMSSNRGSLDLLEPFGLVQVCNGTDLPFTTPLHLNASGETVTVLVSAFPRQQATQ